MLLCIAICSMFSGTAASANKTIYFMAAGPLPDTGSFKPFWPGGTAVIHAVKLARDHINERSDILPGYRLEMIEADSGCNIVSKYAIAAYARDPRCCLRMSVRACMRMVYVRRPARETVRACARNEPRSTEDETKFHSP